MTRILLVDDDVELASLLKDYLEREGYEAQLTHDGETGAQTALGGAFDLIVLDVMLPRLNGIEALRRIRAASLVPVLMLTARGDDVDRVVGLELGADDYVPKPCTPRELVARIRAILRRTQGMGAPSGEGETALSSGSLELRPERRSATWGGQSLELTAAEFNLLEVLVRHVGQVVDKNALSQEGMGRPLTRYDRSIDVHISSIRRKLATCTPTELIQTIRGVGYQLIRE